MLKQTEGSGPTFWNVLPTERYAEVTRSRQETAFRVFDYRETMVGFWATPHTLLFCHVACTDRDGNQWLNRERVNVFTCQRWIHLSQAYSYAIFSKQTQRELTSQTNTRFKIPVMWRRVLWLDRYQLWWYHCLVHILYCKDEGSTFFRHTGT